MKDWELRLSDFSRDRRKLVIAAGIIGAVSVVLALFIDVAVRQAPIRDGEGRRLTLGGVLPGYRILLKDFERVQEALLQPPELSVRMVVWFFQEAADLYGLKGAGRQEAPAGEERGDLLGRAGPVVVGELLEKTDMGEPSRKAFDRYARAVFLDGEAAAAGRADLIAMSETESAPPHANLMLADLLRREGDLDGALEALGREGADKADHRVRRKVLDQALAKGDREALLQIRDSPDFAPVLTWPLRRELATQVRDYPALFGAVFMTVFGKPPGVILVVLTLIGAAAWFAILVGFVGFSGHRWWGFLIPVAAGMLSVVPTLFILILQEDINGLQETGEVFNDLIYWIAGVGLREEVSKLLLFACFLPYLLKKRSPAHALIAAACVGLGFAAEENSTYITNVIVPGANLDAVASGVAFSRYVTSTCIHIFLTGILGYALYWMCISVRRHYEQFLIAFIFAVVIHGLYDFVLSSAFGNLVKATDGKVFDQQLAFWITVVIIAACAYRFFDLVDASRLPGRRLISPLGLFVVGGAVIFGSALMVASSIIPFRLAFSGSGKAALGVALVAWIYINRFRDE